mgnify:CR=1 FL=1
MLSSRRFRAGLAAAGLVAALLGVTGCQVQPLYGSTSSSGSVANATIAISPPTNRVGRVVRNELVFAFGQGSGEPVNAEYRLDLSASASTAGVLPTGLQNDFSAARVTASGSYRLVVEATGEQIAAGSRRAMALLDYPAQGYSNVRAVRDAEDRAARELAALIRADIVAKLAARAR